MSIKISKCGEFYEKWWRGRWWRMPGEPFRVPTSEEMALGRKPNDEKEIIIDIFAQRVF